jgi:hypothetical protein
MQPYGWFRVEVIVVAANAAPQALFCPYNPLRKHWKKQASFRLMKFSAIAAGKHLITPHWGFFLRTYPSAEKSPNVNLMAPVFSGRYR